MQIEIKTVDSAGHPIPWVSVGAAYEAENKEAYKGEGFTDIDVRPSDPYRILRRHPDSWEYWNNFNSPVLALRYAGVTDSQGKLVWEVKHDGLFKKNPGVLEFGFAGYRYGLEPADVRVQAKNKAKKIEVTIVLNKTKNFVEDLPAYLVSFYQAKFDLNDSKRNAAITMDNYHRLENIRKLLIEAAQQAHIAGDARSAGLIMFWVAICPKVLLYQGKPNGYNQSFDFDFSGDSDYKALTQALAYDPDNDHLRSRWMLKQYRGWLYEKGRQGIKVSREEKSEFRRVRLKDFEALAEKSGPVLWANFYSSMISDYGYFKDWGKKIEQLRWLQNYEPRWKESKYFETRIRLSEEHMQEQEAQKQ